MLNFSGRFKEAREYFGMNKVEFAKYLKVAPSTITRYESGSMDIAIGAIEKISNKLNINMAWLLGIDDNMYDAEILYKKIPVLHQVKKNPVMAFENFEGFEIIANKYKVDFCTRLDGNTVFFKKQNTAENGDTIAVLDGSNIIVRKYNKYGNQIVLKNESRGLDVMVEDVNIIGKAVLIMSEVA